MYNISSNLYEMSKVSLLENLNDASEIEKIGFPLIISKDLRASVQDVWMKQGPMKDPSTYNYSELDITRMDHTEFTMLMNFDTSKRFWFLPEVVNTYVHVLKSFYSRRLVGPFRMCKPCFDDEFLKTSLELHHRWGVEYARWVHHKCSDHFLIRPHKFASDVVHKPYWLCSKCVKAPLFEIVEEERCRSNWPKYHECEYNSFNFDVEELTPYVPLRLRYLRN